MWRIDEELLEPYNRLASALNALQYLRRRKVYSTAELTDIQQEVNAVESQFVVDGRWVASTPGTASSAVSSADTTTATPSTPTTMEPKMGQAYLFSLLFHCHRLSRKLLEANEPGRSR